MTASGSPAAWLRAAKAKKTAGDAAEAGNAAAAFPQPSPLGIARSTTDADDPPGRGSTQLVQAVSTLRFDLGETLQQSMQVEGIAHRPWFKHR